MKDPILTESFERCVLGVIDMKVSRPSDDYEEEDDDDLVHDADSSEEQISTAIAELGLDVTEKSTEPQKRRRSVMEFLKSSLDKVAPNKLKSNKNKKR